MVYKKLRNFYHSVRLGFWVRMKYPVTLRVANTNDRILVHNWPTALLLKTTTTRVTQGRMFYEPIERPYFERLARDKKVFFDLGAFVGYYSVMAHGLGVRACYAFEIVDLFVDITEKNFSLNNIPGKVTRMALGKPGEQIQFEYSIFSDGGIAKSLDDFSESANVWPDVLKIDIEGAELDTLRAMPKILKRHPALDISVHPTFLQERGQNEEEVMELLSSYGYTVIFSGGDTYFLV